MCGCTGQWPEDTLGGEVSQKAPGSGVQCPGAQGRHQGLRRLCQRRCSMGHGLRGHEPAKGHLLSDPAHR